MRCPCCQGLLGADCRCKDCGYQAPVCRTEWGYSVDWREMVDQRNRFEQRVEELLQENPKWWIVTAREQAMVEIFGVKQK